jgi:tetraacyldisaccharide 4'-kinase
LREPLRDGLARADAVVLLGDDATGLARHLDNGPPVLTGRVRATGETAWLAGTRVLAFAGIARPGKLAATLRALGAEVADCAAFPDHHRYTSAELAHLTARAARLGARLVTTAKDAMRLPPEAREAVAVLSVAVAWDEPGAVDRLLRERLGDAG